MKKVIKNARDISEGRYTMMAWLFDRRCNENCKLTTYKADTRDELLAQMHKIKKAWGDSVTIIDKLTGEHEYVALRPDQRVE